jgi:hypothetical protein
MVSRFFVPKFITIEDRLAGLLTFRQLFALLGAFLLTFFVFRINQFLGILVGLISFALAFLFTFIYINGRPFIYVFPSVLDFLFRSRRFAWQRIEKVIYKEVPLPEEIEVKAEIPKIPEKKVVTDRAEIILEYPETNIKEKLTISLKEPIALQADEINRFIHRHLLNPRNPYRFFPYIKFYQHLK